MNSVAIDRNYSSFSTPRRVERKAHPVKDGSGEQSPRRRQRRRPCAKALLGVLRQEITLHEELLNIKKKERPCLAAGVISELEKVTRDLNELVEHIHKVEDLRRQEMVRWAEFLGCKPAHITLRMIAQHLSPAEGETLIEVGDQLKALVVSVRDENHMNQLLLRRSIRLVNEEVKLFTGGEGDNRSYTSTGAMTSQRPPARSCLLDCRA